MDEKTMETEEAVFEEEPPQKDEAVSAKTNDTTKSSN